MRHNDQDKPIKDTPTLKTPITGSYLGKRIRHSESGPTDMSPVVTEPLTLTENPFNPDNLTENLVVTELDFIGKEDLGLLAEIPIPNESLKEGKT